MRVTQDIFAMNCSDFKTLQLFSDAKCCNSCHTDYEDGYVDFLMESEEALKCGIDTSLCCKMKSIVDEKIKDLIAEKKIKF